MSAFQDLSGQPFHQLTVLYPLADRSKGVRWVCQCLCGTITSTPTTNALKSGRTRSCGCLWSKTIREKATTHHFTGTSIYRIWSLMIQRCHNTNNPAYHRYGGRGIVVCPAWRTSFETFYKDMGDRPSTTYSLERRDNNGPYDSWNCYWATAKQQAHNRRKTTYLTFRGETKSVHEWEVITGISYRNILQRLRRYGFTIEQALTLPLGARKSRC